MNRKPASAGQLWAGIYCIKYARLHILWPQQDRVAAECDHSQATTAAGKPSSLTPVLSCMLAGQKEPQ